MSEEDKVAALRSDEPTAEEVVTFATEVLGVQLAPWQVEWIWRWWDHE